MENVSECDHLYKGDSEIVKGLCISQHADDYKWVMMKCVFITCRKGVFEDFIVV